MGVEALDILHVEEAVWVAARDTRNPVYDFAFDRYLACRRPLYRETVVTAIGRMGAFEDYAGTYADLEAEGIALINTPDEHHRASELTAWYPQLADLTPRSLWFDEAPDAAHIEAVLGWPVFVKGSRQTSRHNRSLSIARTPAEYEALLAGYRADPILRWQKVVVRQLLSLRPVEGGLPTDVPASFEFRTFWYRRSLVGTGRYWLTAEPYDWTPDEQRDALAVAQKAVDRLAVPFLVVDLAQTAEGRWVIIECNDGQEAGYAGVSPLALWHEVVRLSRESAP